MTSKKLKELKKGEYFTLKPVEEPSEAQVYVKDDYDRSERKYLAMKFTDIWGSGRYFKGDKVVYVDFTF